MQSAVANFPRPEGSESPSRFLDTMSLRNLLAPISEEEFLADHWEKKPLIVHRANPGYYGDLFTLQDFDDSMRGGRGYIKTAEATTKTQARHTGTAPNTLEAVLADMRNGHTLILDGMHDFNRNLGHMCRMLGRETGSRCQTNIYLTPPNGKGFSPHWDNHCVFVLQVMGSKHWKVEKIRRVLPPRLGQIEDEGRELRGDLHTFTLNPGDMVYIPRGFVHAAECGAESSLHITLGVYPPAWDELLVAAVNAAISSDDGLRLSLPLDFMSEHSTMIVEKMSRTLQSVADPSFLARVLERFRDEIVQRAQLDISGQVLDYHQARPLKIDDVVGTRPGLFYTLRKEGETVVLKVGTRSIAFPDFFGPAVEFALSRSDYAIRDLPGDLENEERIAFAERLMQEALVVRR